MTRKRVKKTTEAGKSLLRLFGDFGARGVWRLLYMGTAIVIQGNYLWRLWLLAAQDWHKQLIFLQEAQVTCSTPLPLKPP